LAVISNLEGFNAKKGLDSDLNADENLFHIFSMKSFIRIWA